jgi:hypothetical protein
MGSVQFWGNTDPQNKVTNEFAAPVLARSVRYSTSGVIGPRVLCSRVLAQGGTQWVLLLAVPVLARSVRYVLKGYSALGYSRNGVRNGYYYLRYPSSRGPPRLYRLIERASGRAAGWAVKDDGNTK